MACKNHTIKVSDETWAAWSAHAASLQLSVTKMLVSCVNTDPRKSLQYLADDAARAHKDGTTRPLPQAPRMLGINQERDTPDVKTFKSFTKSEQLKKGGK